MMSGESYKTYIPAKLPPEPPIELTMLYPYLKKSMLALAELNTKWISFLGGHYRLSAK